MFSWAKKQPYFKFIIPIFIVAVFILFSINFFSAAESCLNNICKGSKDIGGDNVYYYYTKYLSPDGQLKIRFVSGAKNGYVSYAVAGLSVEPQANVLPSPLGGSKPELDTITITQTNSIIFESDPRAAGDGPIDFVANISLAGISEGSHNISLVLVQNNANGQINLNFEVNSNYPLNDNENMNFGSVSNTCSDYPAADPLWGDNDLDYYADCRDSDCDNLYAGVAQGSDVYCRYEDETPLIGEENNCYDRFDNDFDKDGNTGWDYNRETGIDCRDLDCENQQGDKNDSSKLCWYNNSNEQGQGEAKGYPLSCRDGFNNDIDNGSGSFVGIDHYANSQYLDCVDTNCWRLGGLFADIINHPCPAREDNNPSWCADGIDNDFDDGVNSLDKDPNSGADCQDYDCRLVELSGGDYYNPEDGRTYACPYNEQINVNGEKDPSLCFDGIDNDLDYYRWDGSEYVFNPEGGIDCADPDCIGAKDPATGRVCYPNEFEIGLYQVCGDGVDNDGDDPDDNYIHEQSPIGGFDCEDDRHEDGNAPDCWQMFGNCGPCPDKENITYSSCADSLDNDLDNNFDCADNDCLGMLGGLDNAAFCVASGGETGEMCFDEFDNDAAGGTDCADAGCSGASKVMAYGLTKECGAENNSSLCSDTFDNDGNSERDCLDDSCSGKGDCAGSWPTSSCVSFPAIQNQQISSTISASAHRNLHLGDVHHFEVSGSASNYSYLLVMVGSPVNESIDYPYELSNAKCSFDLPSNVIFIEDSGSAYHYGKFQNTGPVGNFTIKIDCQASSTPKGPDNFMIDIVVNSEAGPENGNKIFAVQTFENTPPAINKIEVGGMDNDFLSVSVPYGGSLAFRGVPEDPNGGFGASGICACDASFSAWEFTSLNTSASGGPDCKFSVDDFRNDDYFCVSVRTTDGAGNIGDLYFSGGVDGCDSQGDFLWYVDVTPITSGDMSLERKDSGGNYYTDSRGFELRELVSPFYKAADILAFDGAGFRTADNGSFPDNFCQLKITNEAGTVVYSGASAKQGNGNTTVCSGEYNLSDDFGLAADGTYFINASVTDNEGYTIESNRKVFYICNSDPLSYPEGHFCSRADFDQDGAAEGIYAKGGLYSTSGLVCDNCPNLYNPDQIDLNANGIGDVCEPAGFCIATNEPCMTDQDCENNFCANGQCSLGGEACIDNSDCLLNYCNSNLGICDYGGAPDPDCPEGLCILDGQCACGGETYSCLADPGYCLDAPAEICLVDGDCRESCVNGQCETGGGSCSGDEDCWPVCNIGEEPPGACSDNPSKTCSVNEDCRDTCVTISGDDEDANDDGQIDSGSCVIDGASCETGSNCGENSCVDGRCSLSGDVCGPDLQCPVNYCDSRYGRCSDNHAKVCMTRDDCGIFAYCEKDLGVKLIYDPGTGDVIGWEYCYFGEDCEKSWGVCDETGLICTDDIHCPGVDEKCGDLGFSWLETQFGGVYTRGGAKAQFTPPSGHYNATYCIRAQGDIVNLTSAAGCVESVEEPFNYPQTINRFTNIIGKIDLRGIRAGQYGNIEILSNQLFGDKGLENKVYIYNADGSYAGEPLVVGDLNIVNNLGAGLVVVYGDLHIQGNIKYSEIEVDNISKLASLGWIVLDNPRTPEKEGNIIISPSVTKIAGAFYVEGEVNTGKGFNPLTVRGLMLAKEFKFERLFASMARGAEQIIYDGRAQANPPPGMADLAKALPVVRTGR